VCVPFPRKPRGMHWRTYDRLRLQGRTAEGRHWELRALGDKLDARAARSAAVLRRGSETSTASEVGPRLARVKRRARGAGGNTRRGRSRSAGTVILIKQRGWGNSLHEYAGDTLQGAKLGDLDLNEAELGGMDLSYADLSGTDLVLAYMYLTDLTGANLSRANLARAHMRRANLAGADLTRANLRWTYMRSANLRGANLTRANLDEANVRNANFTGANLSGVRLTKANLSEEQIASAIIDDKTVLPDHLGARRK